GSLKRRRTKPLVQHSARKQNVRIRGKHLAGAREVIHGRRELAHLQEVRCNVLVPGFHVGAGGRVRSDAIKERAAKLPVHADVTNAQPSAVPNDVRRPLRWRLPDGVLGNQPGYIAVESSPPEKYLVRPFQVCLRKRAGVTLCLCDDGFQLEPGPGSTPAPPNPGIPRLMRVTPREPLLETIWRRSRLGEGWRRWTRKRQKD